jgi:hypothetical protein
MYALCPVEPVVEMIVILFIRKFLFSLEQVLESFSSLNEASDTLFLIGKKSLKGVFCFFSQQKFPVAMVQVKEQI